METQYSLIDAAVLLLETEKKPYDLYELFDIVTKGISFSGNQKGTLVTKFYSDLTTSAKFVYTGDNQWDLKANQKIELWEKDGSFYKEYTKVELPDEYKPEPKTKKAAAKPVVVKPKKVEIKKVEPVVEVVEEVTPVVAEPVAAETPVPAFVDASKEDVVAHYEEEVFEEYDEFDEEKYNEYMDTYEDQYDKKK